MTNARDVERLAALLKICRDAGYVVEETATYLAACGVTLAEAPPTDELIAAAHDMGARSAMELAAPPTAAQEAWLVYDNVRGEYLTTGDSLALFADMATAYRAAERWAVDRCSDDPWRFQPHRAALARQEEP